MNVKKEGRKKEGFNKAEDRQSKNKAETKGQHKGQNKTWSPDKSDKKAQAPHKDGVGRENHEFKRKPRKNKRVCLAPLKLFHLLVSKFMRIGDGYGKKTVFG